MKYVKAFNLGLLGILTAVILCACKGNVTENNVAEEATTKIIQRICLKMVKQLS